MSAASRATGRQMLANAATQPNLQPESSGGAEIERNLQMPVVICRTSSLHVSLCNVAAGWALIYCRKNQ